MLGKERVSNVLRLQRCWKKLSLKAFELRVNNSLIWISFLKYRKELSNQLIILKTKHSSQSLRESISITILKLAYKHDILFSKGISAQCLHAFNCLRCCGTSWSFFTFPAKQAYHGRDCINFLKNFSLLYTCSNVIDLYHLEKFSCR